MAGLFDPRPIPVWIDGERVGEAVYWQDAWEIIRAHNRALDPIVLFLSGKAYRVDGEYYAVETGDPKQGASHAAA